MMSNVFANLGLKLFICTCRDSIVRDCLAALISEWSEGAKCNDICTYLCSTYIMKRWLVRIFHAKTTKRVGFGESIFVQKIVALDKNAYYGCRISGSMMRRSCHNDATHLYCCAYGPKTKAKKAVSHEQFMTAAAAEAARPDGPAPSCPPGFHTASMKATLFRISPLLFCFIKKMAGKKLQKGLG